MSPTTTNKIYQHQAIIRFNSSIVFLFLYICFALTGFVCTHKIQAEEECLSSNIFCYECDSRYDPNCADPFDFSSLVQQDQQYAQSNANTQPANPNETTALVNNRQQHSDQQDHTMQELSPPDLTTTINSTSISKQKKLPAVLMCRGCCVKITSKTPDGANYVKRTCTTNLQINYFMVGLVCMKESGDRGKMCFCETDYCNGQRSSLQPQFGLLALVVIAVSLIKFIISLSIIQQGEAPTREIQQS